MTGLILGLMNVSYGNYLDMKILLILAEFALYSNDVA